jgi:DNA (cytosine-5)-methyltransferase 1
VREAARLQSFPDNVELHGTIRQRCMQIGNAVPPLLAYQLGTAMQAGTVVDLFAGAGGVGLGLGWAGHEIVASVDNNSDACRTLRGHGEAGHQVLERDLALDTHIEDVIDRVRHSLRGRPLGLLAGGPPCQGFSTAGPCRVDDPRNRLVLSFLRLAEALRPQEVLFENVVALRWRGKPFLDELVERLGSLGYAVSVAVLHAEAYGVPQLRRRLVLRASASGRDPHWPLPSHAMSKPNFPSDQPGPHREAPGARTVRDAIADLAVAGGGLDEDIQALPPTSDFARWARGEVQVEDLFNTSASGHLAALDVGA